MKKIASLLIVSFLLVGTIQAETEQTPIKKKTKTAKIEKTIKKLFIYTDSHQWDKLKKIFADKVLLDYSSFTGKPAAKLSPDQIIANWSGFLPKFKHTHHQLGNILAKRKNDVGELFCYGTASHYLPNKSGNHVWTVVGTYKFHLKRIQKKWKVTQMVFNFKYQQGNLELPKLAQKAAG